MKTLFTIACSCLLLSAYANQNVASIYVNAQKLNALDKVLYIAAHPDDENTRALAWFSLGLHAETAYFSLTRGDGGQNLIGKELSEDLGVLRTQELIAARSYDGAKQYFSKAVDFGYSKSAEESFMKWGKSTILSDVVLMIRRFKPHIIVTRFPPDKRAGHGHHTASAILAIEAFKKAADPHFLPKQVSTFGTWQATSIYWNSSTWANKNVATEATGNPNYLVKNIGGYNPLLGKSYNEIGTIARSQHKCQGFGAIIEKGSRTEYFEHLGGKKLSNHFFENNTETWSTILSKPMETKMNTLLDSFDFIHPEHNVKLLFSILEQLKTLPESMFKDSKIQRCKQLILDCIGLDIEVIGNDFAFTHHENATININAINRSNQTVRLVGAKMPDFKHLTFNQALTKNNMHTQTVNFTVNQGFSIPYWLKNPFENTYVIKDESLLLQAENKPTFNVDIELNIAGHNMTQTVALEHKQRDPAYGERRRLGISTPDFTINFSEKSIILKAGQHKTVIIKAHSFKDNVQSNIILKAPKNWELSQTNIPIHLKRKHETYFTKVILSPTKQSQRGILKAVDIQGNELKSYTEIAYNHIPTQTIFKPSEMACIKIEANIKTGKIAYIKGAEDLVPQAIEQLGFKVDVFKVKDLPSLDLATYQSVVLGIRIYNVHPEIRQFENKLFNYVKQGGNLVMQYNTASRKTPNAKFGGPLGFNLSRHRVTDEHASVKFLAPNHPIMNYPNKITSADFENWVQERGLYFAANWDKKYTPLFAWHDNGETDQKGSIIVAKYGKGQFVYTGISFFRELPRGVEGAYRLFANILSYETK